MRHTESFQLSDVPGFREKLLVWGAKFGEFFWLNGRETPGTEAAFDVVLAVDAARILKQQSKGAFKALDDFQQETNDWLFGYMGYDLKNDTEALVSGNYDGPAFPDMCFFQPRRIIRLRGEVADFIYLPANTDKIKEDFRCINDTDANMNPFARTSPGLRLTKRVSEKEYLDAFSQFQHHIYRGDIYEANYCQEFYATDACVNPLETYHRLDRLTRAPFSSLMRTGHYFLISASPERFMMKTGPKLAAQPMKGTSRRSAVPEEDVHLRNLLEADPKERSENIMIVDLVRNDLSKLAIKGSVSVKELCKVYTFNQVHQMISTITAEVDEHTPPVAVLKNAFPMGSMTGAPKLSAMRLIEKYESAKRGVYSGAAGYFKPGGDFDFFVVIRSILYNAMKKYVSFSVGSAITARSLPLAEYTECMLKADAMRTVLEDG